MAGRKLVLPTTFTDTSLPVLPTTDPMDAPGSLVLIDPSHPVGPWAAGVPANAASIPNLYAAKLKTIMGTALDADVNLSMVLGASVNGTKGLLERSTKGGVHSITSPTVADSTSVSASYFDLPAALKNYLVALPDTDQWFCSTWQRITKQAASLAGHFWDLVELGSNVGFATNKRIALGNSPYPASGRSTTPVSNGGPPIGPAIFNNVANSWLGTKPAAGSNMTARVYLTGVTRNTTTDPQARAMGARIFYRFYLENLTASGRTYAQADAIDNALYTAQVLTAGGRYYGDTTTTNPATFV